MVLSEACEVAKMLHAREHWHVIGIYNLEDHEPVSGIAGFSVKAYNCGVIFTFHKPPSEDDLTTLETYGM